MLRSWRAHSLHIVSRELQMWVPWLRGPWMGSENSKENSWHVAFWFRSLVGSTVVTYHTWKQQVRNRAAAAAFPRGSSFPELPEIMPPFITVQGLVETRFNSQRDLIWRLLVNRDIYRAETQSLQMRKLCFCWLLGKKKKVFSFRCFQIPFSL